MSFTTAVAILEALKMERQLVDEQLRKLEALDAGSAHCMEIGALEQQHDQLQGAIDGIGTYLDWRQ